MRLIELTILITLKIEIKEYFFKMKTVYVSKITQCWSFIIFLIIVNPNDMKNNSDKKINK